MPTEIGRLNLRLPAGFEKRAGRIGRLVGTALSTRDLPPGQIEHLSIGPLKIDARRSDHAIAEHIAGAIHGAIDRSGR
jgi:hypothetical protein